MRNPFKPQPELAPPPGELDIALWGPTGAGKTCLIYALAQELATHHNRRDPNFEYYLRNEQGNPILRDGDQDRPPASDEAKDTIIHFTRLRKRDGAPVVTHNLNIHDDRGLNAIRVGSTDVDSISVGAGWRSEMAIAEANMTSSVAIIAFLDIGYTGYAPSAPDLGILAADPDYRQRIEDLLSFLSSLGAPRPLTKYLAVCVSKVDLRPTLRRNADFLMSALFPDTNRLLDAYNGRDGLVIRKFQTSAVGFLPSRDARPNFNPDTGWLLMPHRWVPFNTAAPFFWIFEEMEKKFLPPNQRHAYPPPMNWGNA